MDFQLALKKSTSNWNWCCFLQYHMCFDHSYYACANAHKHFNLLGNFWGVSATAILQDQTSARLSSVPVGVSLVSEFHSITE